MSIDTKLAKLQEIVKKLDSGNVSFEESLRLFEEGSLTAKELYEELSKAKGKISVLKQDVDKFKEEDWD